MAEVVMIGLQDLWELAMSKEAQEARRKIAESSPRVEVPPHDDNCGSECRNVGVAIMHDMRTHDCCGFCNDLADSLGGDS